MTAPLARDSVSVVVKGSFNPPIFSPAWMRAQDLVGETEYSKAKTEVIVPELAVIKMDWLRCQVTQQDMTVSTNEPSEFERARDVAVGVLRTLSHTPIRILGVNRECHFSVASAEEWHAIGDALAPKDIWEGTLASPGMKSVTLWGVRPDKYAGRIQVKVEPSNPVQPYGVFVGYNDHRELVELVDQPASPDDLFRAAQQAPPESTDKLAAAVEVLTTEWSTIMMRAEAAVARVWSLREGGPGGG